MVCRAPGSECRIFVDGIPTLDAGHYLYTRGGTAYFVQEVRPSKTRPSRRHLRCIRLHLADIPEGAAKHELVWYRRKKRVA